MARRFPGLEVDYPTSHCLYLKKGIKGANWLTLLGDQWLVKLGGRQHLSEQLGPEYGLYDYPGGVMIQAGPRPRLGDRNADRWPRLYVKLARLLQPIRITDHRSFHEIGPNRFTKETSHDWLARFDHQPE